MRWNQPLTVEIDSDGCAGSKNEIRYLEHVQLILTLEYSRRGDLIIVLTTPMGTKTVLLPTRSEDSSDEGFKKWPFMTTHAWGEDPRGKWTFEIRDAGDARANTGTLRDWQLVLFGTKEKPHHQAVTHPEVPLHRKAVQDDIKKIQGNQQPSVTITKVTYTFGSNPVSQPQPPPQPLANIPQGLPDLPTITPINNEAQKAVSLPLGAPSHIIDNLLASPINQMSRFHDQSFPRAQSYGSLGVSRPQAFPPSNFHSNSFPFIQARSSVPYAPNYMKRFNARNFQSQSITNYYLAQRQQINDVQRSRPNFPYKWRPSSTSIGMLPNQRANIWDYFGRTYKKRSLPKTVKSSIRSLKQSNSLIRTVKNRNSKLT